MMFFKILKYYFKKERVNLQIHYAFLTGGGFILGIIRENISIKNMDFLKFFITILIILIAFYSSLSFNDIYDYPGDIEVGKKTPLTQGYVKRKNYLLYGILLVFLSLIFSFFLGPYPFLIMFSLHILHLLYSIPPLRLKRIFPLSLFILSLAALLSCLFGFSVIAERNPFKIFPFKLYLIFILAFPFAMNFRDVLDLKGDKIQGVKTLAVIVGERKAPLFGGISLFITYIFVAVILSKPIFLILSIIAGILSIAFSIKKNYDETPLFFIYFSYLIIFILIIYLNPKYLF